MMMKQRKEQQSQQQQQNYNRISQAKVENVLKRVDEYIAEGKKKDAFFVLNSTVSLRKGGTKLWTENYELTMQKFVELCVDLRKGQDSKQGLAQYRNICQTSNMDSFINIVDLIIDLSEKKLKESVLSKDEAEIEASIKFLWDTYRNVLELSKSNPKLEGKYELIATKGFDFCLVYKKKQEFRKLSETVRTHTSTAVKTDKVVANLQLQTKYKQLIVACELELYQDAYRAAEEIHILLTSSLIQPTDDFMANYYQQLVKIFWVSKNYLFHSVSLFRLYNVKKKSLNLKEKSKLVSNLLLAMLCIQNPTNEEDLIVKGKLLKMSALIGSTLPPTKDSVYEQFNSKNLLSLVYPELSEAYKVLIEEYNPLEICNKMENVFKFLSKEENKEFSCYIPVLQEITVHKFIEQISQVYSTIKTESIQKIVTFMNIYDIERIIVQQRTWNAEIDHVKGVITFYETLETPSLRDSLVNFGKKLSTAYSMIKQTEQERKSQMEKIGKAIEEEKDLMIKRRLFIERKKKWEEEQERNKEKIKQEKAQVLAQQRLKEDEERVKKEAEKREELRKKEEEQKLKDQKAIEELKKLLEEESQNLSAAKKKQKKPIDVTTLSSKAIEDLIKSIKDEKEREIQAKEKRLQEEVKNLDYLERAKREIEIPRIEKKFEELKSQETEEYEKYLVEAKQQHIQKIEKDKVERERLLRMKDGKQKFLEKELEQKKKELEEKKKVYQQKKEEERVKWEEKRKAIIIEIEKRKKEEEEKKRQREEEQEKLKKIAEIQRQKEEEIERKLQEKKQTVKEEPKKPSRWGNTTEEPKKETTSRWGNKVEEPKKETTEGGRWGPKSDEKKKDDEGFETVQKKTTGGGRWQK